MPDGDYLVYDLEGEHAHTDLQRDLLVDAVRLVPEIFLGWKHPFGREDPRWVLRVPARLDAAVRAEVRALCLEDPVYLAMLGAAWRREAGEAHAARRRRAGVEPILQGLRRTGAFAAFNWLVPVRETAEELARLLGPPLSPLDLLIPSGLPLSVRLERAQVLFCESARRRRTDRSSLERLRRWYDRHWGCLAHEPFETAPKQRAALLDGHVGELLALPPELLREKREALRRLTRRHRRRLREQQALLHSERAARLPPATLLWAAAALGFLHAVVDQEEERHLIRSRGFALLEGPP